MPFFSVVIICKNEAGIIGDTLQNLQGLTDDIIVYDNGSTDGTQQLVRQFPVHLYEGPWEGFGKTKNRANARARYDWILSLDADETIDKELQNALQTCNPDSDKEVFQLAFRNYLGKKPLHFGDWGRDYHVRLFNRKMVSWDESAVHESLVLPADSEIKKLSGHILHRTWRDLDDYKAKMLRYAALGAEKYFRQGKKSSWFKQHLSPAFAFLRSYILRLGFLDGHAGYQCAVMMAYYTKMKYQKLSALNKEKK